MSNDPGKPIPDPQRRTGPNQATEEPNPFDQELTRSPGIESLLTEVSRYYEEQLTVLNKELVSLRAELARAQFPPVVSQPSELEKLQEALNKMDRELIGVKSQLDQADEKVDSLANLYLAAFSLHQSHDWASVIRALNDIVVNQVGADSFVVLLSKSNAEFETLMQLGSIGELPASEEIHDLMNDERVRYDYDKFVAVIPLVRPREAIGIILIGELLPQKKELGEEDKKLMTALSSLAATALGAAVHLRDRSNEIEKNADEAGRSSMIAATSDNRADGIQVATDLTNRPNVPPVIPASHSNIKTAEDRLPDLSELPPSLLDYSTLLSTAPENFGESDSYTPSPEEGESAAGAEEYLKLLTESGSPTDTSQQENDPSNRQPGSVHREVGLMFRRAPIKRG